MIFTVDVSERVCVEEEDSDPGSDSEPRKPYSAISLRECENWDIISRPDPDTMEWNGENCTLSPFQFLLSKPLIASRLVPVSLRSVGCEWMDE